MSILRDFISANLCSARSANATLSGSRRLRNCTATVLWLIVTANTIVGMWDRALWYSQMGLMVGSVFQDVLADLQTEGHPLAPKVAEIMRNRTLVGVSYPSSAPCHPGPCACFNCTFNTGNTTTDCPTRSASGNEQRSVTIYHCPAWADNPSPFGSEFAWDSTGQEEEYVCVCTCPCSRAPVRHV